MVLSVHVVGVLEGSMYLVNHEVVLVSVTIELILRWRTVPNDHKIKGNRSSSRDTNSSSRFGCGLR